MARKPTKKTVRAAIRASVPDGKLKAARILLAEIEQNKTHIGGFTEYNEKGGGVRKVAAPIGDDAFSLTVRGHETRHASKHTMKRKKPMTPNEAIASQIVDDVNIEMLPVPEIKGATAYRRAHLATAVRDLRGIYNTVKRVRAGKQPDRMEIRNQNITCGTRVLAMAMNYGGNAPDMRERRIKTRVVQRLRDSIGTNAVKAIWDVIRVARSSRHRARAIAMLAGLLETPLTDVDSDEELPQQKGDSEILMPVADGSALNGNMEIKDLRPKTVFCAKEKSISRKHAPSGVIINPARYVNAVVSGESHGLFTQRIRHKAGGVVLIDASGSMGASRENLKALCQLIPTATVAYYSGSDCNGNGILTIYAYQGKRYAGELPVDTLRGGNSVDLPAIKWMMKLPKPWHFVTDMGFCGGVLGSEAVAKALVEREQSRGNLTVHGSLDAAFEAFGGKGKLPE